MKGYTTITGDLAVMNSGLSDLKGLESLTGVGGRLFIQNNAMLTSFAGLDNLATLGDLTLIGNAGLISVDGLEVLKTAKAVTIINNQALINLNGLGNVTQIDALDINMNNALTSLSMDALERVEGDFSISYNTSLCTSLAEALQTQVMDRDGIGGTVTISGNNECTTP